MECLQCFYAKHTAAMTHKRKPPSSTPTSTVILSLPYKLTQYMCALWHADVQICWCTQKRKVYMYTNKTCAQKDSRQTEANLIFALTISCNFYRHGYINIHIYVYIVLLYFNERVHQEWKVSCYLTNGLIILKHLIFFVTNREMEIICL